ncbi:hypothetical protein DEJ50_01320 [Streptomyces venezuelae]|uniref:Uncharacterized protein n=1 Tax=Streptomyces venezuelae TaxID=54571 RepID=A0A5P2CUT2_STRVZ|nr:hypothetical protein [Streptomyces venezuelae]QES46692.1 hypothetical protein DEJ50_01320 [Streptomyces venezuelae]
MTKGTDARKNFQELPVRTPEDVPEGYPLAWLAERYDLHGEKLSNNALPEGFDEKDAERGTADDAVARLALGEAIRRSVTGFHGNRIHEALLLGATWHEVAGALGIGTDQAREVLRSHADRQYRVRMELAAEGSSLGLSEEEHAVALALTALGDDEPYRGGFRG